MTAIDTDLSVLTRVITVEHTEDKCERQAIDCPRVATHVVTTTLDCPCGAGIRLYCLGCLTHIYDINRAHGDSMHVVFRCGVCGLNGRITSATPKGKA